MNEKSINNYSEGFARRKKYHTRPVETIVSIPTINNISHHLVLLSSDFKNPGDQTHRIIKNRIENIAKYIQGFLNI